MMRALLVAVVSSGAVARADVSPGAARVGWLGVCETRLRRAASEWDARFGVPSVDASHRWDWNVGDDAIELHYQSSRAEQDYRIRVSSGNGRRSFAWRERVIRNARFPEVVDEWRRERMVRGRLATFRAAGMAGLRQRTDFLKPFRPALDACLEPG